MAHVGVVLAGCGYLDGSEIHESTLALLALAKAGASYQGVSPQRDQAKVVNHLDESMPDQTRSMVEESARIVRGNIVSMMDANLEDYDAIIVPGGTGLARNFFNLLEEGENYQVQADVLAFLRAAQEMGKPMGFICIAPMMMPFVYPQGIQMTIGNDTATAAVAESKGAKHIDCAVDDIVIDSTHKAVSTPAYMLANSITEVEVGVSKLVDAVIKMVS